MHVAATDLALFVSDHRNNRVRAVDLRAGTIRTFAGTGSNAYNGAGRSAGATALDRPTAIVTSTRGFIFIADTGHSIVWRAVIQF
jgi:hypothetical protein